MNLQFRFNTEIVQLIGNDCTRLEREQLRARDLERDYPACIYNDLGEASATDFLLFLVTLGTERRDELLARFAPQLVKLSETRRETYRKAKRQLKALRA